MSELIERRLLELGVELPPPAPTVANYLASVRIGQLIFLAGQLPFKDGRLMAMGILGRELGTEAGTAGKEVGHCHTPESGQIEAVLCDRQDMFIKEDATCVSPTTSWR